MVGVKSLILNPTLVPATQTLAEGFHLYYVKLVSVKTWK